MCDGASDYVHIQGDVFIPTCHGCACKIVHPGEKPPSLDSGLMLCPACTLRWAERA